MSKIGKSAAALIAVILALAASLIPAAAQTSAPAADRAALVALYNATNGAGWVDSDGWLSARPIGEWSGAQTDRAGRVIALRLSENNLSGAIPSEIGDLSSLRVLELYDNNLRGEIPSEIGGLSNLRALRLFQNGLTGEIPSEIGGLSNLRALNLARNSLTGEIPSEIGGISGLRALNLSENRLSGAMPPRSATSPIWNPSTSLSTS